MRIGIAAPTRIEKLCAILNISESEYIHFLYTIAQRLAASQHELVLVPDHGSASWMVARNYKDFGGKKVFALVPFDDEEFGQVDLEIADENISCGTWRNQPEKLCEESDCLMVLGLSPGAMIELCYSKWFKLRNVLVFKDFITQPIHEELAKDLNISYVSLDSFMEQLK